jgi:hypothetical protein
MLVRLEKAPAGPPPAPELGPLADDKVREEAQKEIKEVGKKFNRDQLLAGTGRAGTAELLLRPAGGPRRTASLCNAPGRACRWR